mmetsp:Transcript_4507/g.6406  ORF Transcript_4507/g.6406 Transcript_4507/m.6406 type:complete len:231 (-) Transcript_4507:100-792(-)
MSGALLPLTVANINVEDGEFKSQLASIYQAIQGMDLVSIGDVSEATVSVSEPPVKWIDIVRGTQLLTNNGKKLYLDSCATYHSAFVRDQLSRVYQSDMTLHGNCNAGMTISSEKGFLGPFELRLNKQGIANFLSIPQLEEEGYKVQYETDVTQWTVTTPQGKKIVFKQDTGLCNCIPYIDMRKVSEAVAMVQTVRGNFEGFTKKEVEKAIQARRLQAMMAHPSDAEFKSR